MVDFGNWFKSEDLKVWLEKIEEIKVRICLKIEEKIEKIGLKAKEFGIGIGRRIENNKKGIIIAVAAVLLVVFIAIAFFLFSSRPEKAVKTVAVTASVTSDSSSVPGKSYFIFTSILFLAGLILLKFREKKTFLIGIGSIALMALSLLIIVKKKLYYYGFFFLFNYLKEGKSLFWKITIVLMVVILSFLILSALKNWLRFLFGRLGFLREIPVISSFGTFLKNWLVPISLTLIIVYRAYGNIFPSMEVLESLHWNEILILLLRIYIVPILFWGLMWYWFCWASKQPGIFVMVINYLILGLVIIIFIHSSLIVPKPVRFPEKKKSFRVIKALDRISIPKGSKLVYNQQIPFLKDGETPATFLIYKGDYFLLSCSEGLTTTLLDEIYKRAGKKPIKRVNWDAENLVYPREQQHKYVCPEAPIYGPLIGIKSKYGLKMGYIPAFQAGKKWLLVRANISGYFLARYNLRTDVVFGKYSVFWKTVKGRTRLKVYRVRKEEAENLVH